MTPEQYEFIANWFKSQCNGDWEHYNQIKIGTTGNPGWYLEVDLEGTELYNVDIDPYTIGDIDDEGLGIRCKEGKFKAVGGPGSFSELLNLFRDFIISGGKNPLSANN